MEIITSWRKKEDYLFEMDNLQLGNKRKTTKKQEMNIRETKGGKSKEKVGENGGGEEW